MRVGGTRSIEPYRQGEGRSFAHGALDGDCHADQIAVFRDDVQAQAGAIAGFDSGRVHDGVDDSKKTIRMMLDDLQGSALRLVVCTGQVEFEQIGISHDDVERCSQLV